MTIVTLPDSQTVQTSYNGNTVTLTDQVNRKIQPIVLGMEMGITNRLLAEALGLGALPVTRRVEAAQARGAESSDLVKLRKALRSRVGLRQMSTK